MERRSFPIGSFRTQNSLNFCHRTVPPRWIIEPTDKAFAQGSDAKIECKTDGFPKPQVYWKKAPGNRFRSINLFLPHFRTSIFQFSPIHFRFR
jgi:hypothetical protein